MALSELQKQKLTRKFRLLDVDGNGFVEQNDLERVILGLAEKRGWGESSPQREQLLERHSKLWQALETFCDTNSDGQISLDEWLNYHSEAMRVDREELMTIAGYESTLEALADFFFELLDADGDGVVTASDYSEFCEALGVDAGQRSLAPLDRDGDGTISRAEMTPLIVEFYQSSDPNSPGNWFFGFFDV